MVGASSLPLSHMPISPTRATRRSCCGCLRNRVLSNIPKWFKKGTKMSGSQAVDSGVENALISRLVGDRAVDNAGDVSWLIVGLGNIGPRYENTRHNVGFMVIDELARQLDVHMTKRKHKATVGFAMIEESPVLMMKPVTYMNNSGEAVRAASEHYNVPLDRVLVVYDDLDLETATVRLRGKGGHGGHNGMRSIVTCLNGSTFPRIKIGIGRPSGTQSIVSYVLEPFSPDQAHLIKDSIQETIDRIRAVLGLGTEKALSGVTLKSLKKVL